MNYLINKIATHYDLTDTEIISSRKSKCAIVRHMIWYYCHCEKGYSIPAIADKFLCTQREVLWGIKKIKDGIKIQKYYKETYKYFLDSLKE